MKHMYSNLIILSLVIIGFSSCNKVEYTFGSGDIISQTLTVPSFTAIDATAADTVIITQGAVQKIEATGHTNILENLNLDVTDGTWKIVMKNGNYKHYDLVIHITVPNITAIHVKGNGIIFLNDFVNQTSLDVSVDGAGQITMGTIEGATSLSATIIGEGKIICLKNTLSMNTLNIDIDGSGSYLGFYLFAKECNVVIAGIGFCEVYVTDKLDIVLNGDGGVYYRGAPVITQEINGYGIVQPQ